MIKKMTSGSHKSNIDRAFEDAKATPKPILTHIFNQPKSFNKGPLQGVPVLIKDNFATYDAPTTASSNLLQAFQPRYDATVVDKIRKAGGVLVAKTALDEFGMGGTGLHACKGEIHNPVNDKYIVGGSSSGSAFMIAKSKNFGFALASDTGDSARKPSSYNGIYGFKPSYGSVSRYGLFAYSSSLDTTSWMARSVEDIALVGSVLYGKDDKDYTSIEIDFNLDQANQPIKPKKLALVIDEKHFAPFLIKKIKKLEVTLKSQGINVKVINLRNDYIKALLPTYKIISYAEATSNLANLTGIGFGQRKSGQDYQETITKTRSKGFSYMVQRRIMLGSYFLDQEHQDKLFIRAQKVRRLFANYWKEILDNYDAIVYPAQCDQTMKVEQAYKLATERANPYNDLMLFDNFLGSPAITIPFGKENNMPFGLAINSQFKQDQKLLSISCYIDQVVKGLDHE